MKVFAMLSVHEQKQAISYCLSLLFEALLNENMRLNDSENGNNLQQVIDECVAKAEKQQVPWFAHQMIMEAKCKSNGKEIAASKLLTAIATDTAQRAYYLERTELAVKMEQLK